MNLGRLITTGIGLFVASSARATIYTVDCTGAGDFTTIQAAINAAVSGDVIVVRPNTCTAQGRYRERPFISGKSLTIKSVDPTDPAIVAATIIDGSTMDGIVRVIGSPPTADPVRLQGLTIVNGFEGMHLENSSVELDRVTISNCTGFGVSAYVYGGDTNTLLISRCSIHHTRGVSITNYDLKVRSSVFSDATARAFSAIGGTIDIQDSAFLRSGWIAGTAWGGGLDVGNSPSMRIVNCLFAFNLAYRGAGLSVRSYPGAPDNHIIRNCLFYGNLANGYGGGVRLMGDGITVDHCTFVGNRSRILGPGIYCDGGSFRFVNSVSWNNRSDLGPGTPDLGGIDSLIATHCDFQNGLAPANGNFSADPGFLDPGVWDDHGTPDDFSDDTFTPGDFRLSPGSPCINAGDPAYIGTLGEIDLAGRPRTIGCRTDLGAYEANHVGPHSGDLSGDGAVTQDDLPFFIQAALNMDTLDCRADCNGDGLVNGQDITAFLALIH